LSGIDVGTVESVSIVDDTTGRVEVTLNLVEDIKRFIRTDTQAKIETEGLVGNKVVILEIGTSTADAVSEGGTIKSKEPVSISEIIEETQGIMRYTKEVTKDLSEIVARVNRGEGSIGKLLVDEELYTNATQLTRRADQSLQAITDEVNQLTQVFNRLGAGVETVVANVVVDGSRFDSSFTQMVKNITKTSEDAQLAASRLAENMEALKHNWLFKSYFENRGYWDKAEYENEIDAKMEELNQKINMLDQRIETLRSLEKVSN
jgi:phospholipid/cholesterol/gamma-HCH transport system substrate-binding protein